MKGKWIEVGAAVLFITACLMGPLPGCAVLRSSLGHRQPDPPLPSQPTAAAPSAEVTEQAVLAAVEEFLERTKEYRLSSPASAPVSAALAAVSPAAGAGAAGEAVRPALVSDRPSAGRDEASANGQMALHRTPPASPVPALPVVESVSIRSAPPLDVPAVEPAKTNTANEPLDMRPAETPMSFDQVISQLEQRAAEADGFDTEWQLRVAQLALHRDAQAVQVSPSLPPEAGRMLAALIRAALAVRRAAGNPLLADQEAMDCVDELRWVLADRADPVVSTVALCRRVVTFGVYEELSSSDFVAGRTVQAILYSEIRNLKSELTEEGQYQTRLATRLEVLTADGRSVWQQEEPEIVDRCRRRRTDFFIAQRIALPPTLPAGDYILKVLVEDKLSGRADEASHHFVISSSMPIARGP